MPFSKCSTFETDESIEREALTHYLLEELITEVKLLNARIEEAFETNITKEDLFNVRYN